MISRRLRTRVHGSRDLVRFCVSDTMYAAPVASVVAVAKPLEIASTPGASPIAPGYASHRGKVVEVVDLRAWFAPTAPPALHTQWIVLHIDTARCAWIVDRVVDVVASQNFSTLERDRGLSALPHAAAISHTLLDGERMIFVLDPACLRATPHIENFLGLSASRGV